MVDYNPGYKQPGHTAESKEIRRQKMAEGVGFEPTVRVNAHTLSKRAP
jgi:hypothetical protein